MNEFEQERLEKNVRRTAGLSALRKIGGIVAEEQQADAEKERVLRWLARFGWLIAAGVALLAYVLLV